MAFRWTGTRRSAPPSAIWAGTPPGQLFAFKSSGEYEWFASNAVSSDYTLSRALRARPVYYPTADGLEAAYYVEVMGSPTRNPRRDAYGYVIPASSGRVLFRTSLIAYEVGTRPYSYRVFAAADGRHTRFNPPLGNA